MNQVRHRQRRSNCLADHLTYAQPSHRNTARVHNYSAKGTDRQMFRKHLPDVEMARQRRAKTMGDNT